MKADSEVGHTGALHAVLAVRDAGMRQMGADLVVNLPEPLPSFWRLAA